MRHTPVLLVLAASVATAAFPAVVAAQSYDQPAYGHSYEQDQQSYQQQQDAYQRKLQQYNEDRSTYDWRQSGRPYDSSGYDSRDAAHRDTGPCYHGSTASGGIIGALAGAAIGSNLAGRGSRTEGAVLGAVAGGVIGSSVARNTAGCDSRGYYYSYNQTLPYRESYQDRAENSGRYGYRHYRSSGCRLVMAPAQYGGREDTRYARVCPDGSGRYRLTQ